MPTCNECGNDDRFEVSVAGEKTVSFGGGDFPAVEDDRTDWTGARCSECGSGDVEVA